MKALLDELREAITLDGFGCACEPSGPCATCRAREVLRKVIEPIVRKYAAALAVEPGNPATPSVHPSPTLRQEAEPADEGLQNARNRVSLLGAGEHMDTINAALDSIGSLRRFALEAAIWIESDACADKAVSLCRDIRAALAKGDGA